MTPLQHKWDNIYQSAEQASAPAEILQQHLYLLPRQGQALELACGLGANALLLAEAGLAVDAWDISPVALQKLDRQAQTKGLQINTAAVLIDTDHLTGKSYDVIVISRFLDRTLCNAIMAALKPGGLLFYQTFTRHKLDKSGPSNPDYLLARNELLQLFAPLTVIYYQEYPAIGDLQRGNRNEAQLIGQKNRS
jgi:2-polyprenyl-3-methyl-5-hydroxy-6-metoxy-1,4-benzoquinol methylase